MSDDEANSSNEWSALDAFEGTFEAVNVTSEAVRWAREQFRDANSFGAFVAMRIPTVTHNDLEPGMRKGKPFIRKSKRLLEAEASWKAHLGSLRDRLANYGTRLPLSGPLVAKVQFLFEADEAHPAGTPHAGKPDLDNVEKTFWDAMARVGIVEDDRLVFHKDVTKAYDAVPGVRIEIARWEG